MTARNVLHLLGLGSALALTACGAEGWDETHEVEAQVAAIEGVTVTATRINGSGGSYHGGGTDPRRLVQRQINEQGGGGGGIDEETEERCLGLYQTCRTEAKKAYDQCVLKYSRPEEYPNPLPPIDIEKMCRDDEASKTNTCDDIFNVCRLKT